MDIPNLNPSSGTLILVDCQVTLQNSALKAMVKALPALLDAGWRVRVWSNAFDAVDPRIVWEKVPTISRISFIQFLFLSAWTTGRWLRQKMTGKIPPDAIIQSNGASLMWANAVHIQFVSVFYLAMAKAFSGHISLRIHERAIHGIAGLMERLMWVMRGRRRAWIVCSERLAQDLQKRVKAPDLFEVLPNSYDPRRFHQGVVEASRQSRRQRLGLKEGDCVFGFVCTGAFDRKGLPSALRICSLLIQRGWPCRLLVIGGTSSEPPDVEIFAAKAGVTDFSFVVTHGRTKEIPQLLAAADALLFPSFFEAFANVEIEAAALGLRLYLTPHYGSEMIVRDGGVNGCLIPWDPEAAAEVIALEMASEAIRKRAVDCGRALREDEFATAYMASLGRIQIWLETKSGFSPS